MSKRTDARWDRFEALIFGALLWPVAALQARWERRRATDLYTRVDEEDQP